MNKSKGFTLIELLVVIAIIGILSSVVLTSLNSARIKAKTSVYKEELTSLRPFLISQCDSGNLVAGDVAATGAHPAGTIAAGQSCGSSGAGTFSVSFGAPTNGGAAACNGTVINETSLTFPAGC